MYYSVIGTILCSIIQYLLTLYFKNIKIVSVKYLPATYLFYYLLHKGLLLYYYVIDDIIMTCYIHILK